VTYAMAVISVTEQDCNSYVVIVYGPAPGQALFRQVIAPTPFFGRPRSWCNCCVIGKVEGP